MVWKYLLYGTILIVGAKTFKYFGLFEVNPLAMAILVSALALLPVTWFEYGDMRLSKKWQVDAERTNCDRLAKAFLYVSCCILWPKFVMPGADG